MQYVYIAFFLMYSALCSANDTSVSPKEALPNSSSTSVATIPHADQARQTGNARLKEQIDVEYPEEAGDKKIEGYVILALRIDERGVVKSCEAVEAVPAGVFEQSALNAVCHAHYTPALRDGRPVVSLVRMRVKYELGDKPGKVPPSMKSVPDSIQ